MRPSRGALRIPLRSDGFVMLTPPPDIGGPSADAVLANAGLRLAPGARLLLLSEARLHRIRCFRLTLAEDAEIVPTGDVALLVCGAELAGEAIALDGAGVDASFLLPARQESLLLVLPRMILQALASQCLPTAPPMVQWPSRARLGAADSAFAMLIAYLQRLIAECPERMESGDLGVQMEEALVMELVRNWGDPPKEPSFPALGGVVPRHVKLAESYMAAHAAAAPAIAEVARASGVSERVLSAAFRRFRGVTPSAYLREIRLSGVRDALVRAGRGDTVASVAASWSYANFGLFARAYARRFGELPSVTLRRARGG